MPDEAATPRPSPVPLPPDAPTLIDMARASGIVSPDQARQLVDLAMRHRIPLQAAETQVDIPAGLGMPPDKLARLQAAETMADPAPGSGSAHKTRRASEVMRLSGIFKGTAADKVPDLPDVPEEARAAWAMAGNRFGKFVMVTRLGSGAMGDVWRAWQVDLGRWVALKFLKGDNPEEIARFVQEARTAAKLSHPNIVTTFEAGEYDGRRYIAMEYLEGADLGHATLELRRALEAMRDAARAVHYAHEQGIIHRDLKPSNLFLTKHGRICVTDFGLAKCLKAPSGLSQTGALLGTPYYMSPEQAEGKTELDGRSDVFALGATLYHLATGRPPFTGQTWVEILRGVLQEEPVLPRTLNHAIPREVETIILKSLEKEPARRYESCSAQARDLERYLDGEPIHARQASLAYKFALRVRRHRVASAALSVLTIVLATIAFVWWRLPGTLNLNVSPPGAAIRLAGRSFLGGRDPLPVELSAGVYEVEAELADHESEMREVVVERGRTKDLTLRLAHYTGTLEAESQPMGSEIEVDEVAYGSRVRNLALDTGRHRLRAWSAGHVERAADIEVKRGAAVRAFLWLEPAIAWVHLSSGIPGGWGMVLDGPDVDGEDGAGEIVHQEGVALVFRRPGDGRELRRFSPATTMSYDFLVAAGGGGGRVVLAGTEETSGLAVTCIDARREGDGAIRWRFVGPERNWARPCGVRMVPVGDRNGDGVPEVAVGEREPGVWVIDGAIGARLGHWPLPVYGTLLAALDGARPEALLFVGRPTAADGTIENYGDVTAGLLRLDDGRIEWTTGLPKLVDYVDVDLEGDGVRELEWRSASAVGVLDGRTGSLRWSVPVAEHPGIAALAGSSDLDGDGTLELLFRDREGTLIALSGKDGAERWRAPVKVASMCGPGGAGRLPNGDLMVMCEAGLAALGVGDGAVRWTAAGDFLFAQVLDWDGDGRAEVLAGERGVGIACLDAAGKRAWSVPFGADVTPVGWLDDVDGDGLKEIAIHSSAAMIGVMRGPRKLWSRKAAGPLLAAPLVLDADGDGAPDVVQIGPWGMDRGLACFDGRSGLQRWAQPLGVAPNRAPGVGDVDGDGKPDLVVFGMRPRQEGYRVMALRTADGQTAREGPLGDSDSYATPAVLDLNGDGAQDVVFQRWSGHDLHATDGKTGATLWHHGTGTPGMGGVTAGDVDGDGTPELVAAFLDGFVHAVRWDGSLLWKAAIDPEGSRAPATVADLDGDGAGDVLVVSRRGTLWVIDGKTGAVRWTAEGGGEGLGRPVVVRDEKLGTRVAAAQGESGVGVYGADGTPQVRVLEGRTVMAAPAVADLDGDGTIEMAVATWDGELVVVDFATGARLWGMRLGDKGAESEPAVADLDGDGVKDVLVADHAGNLQAISGRGTIGARRRK